MRYLLILLILVSSCRMLNRDEEDIPKADITELQIVDSEFSDYSKQYGMRKAFLEYIDDDGVMMKDQSLPIKGARAIDLISSMNDSTVTMTWEPEGGEIAASGELGYTYGIYAMRDRENNVQRTHMQGNPDMTIRSRFTPMAALVTGLLTLTANATDPTSKVAAGQEADYQAMLEDAERARAEAEAARREAVHAAERARETARFHAERARQESGQATLDVEELERQRVMQHEEMARAQEELSRAHRELLEATREIARAHRELARSAGGPRWPCMRSISANGL